MKVFRGMSKDALEYAVGFWEKEKRLLRRQATHLL